MVKLIVILSCFNQIVSDQFLELVRIIESSSSPIDIVKNETLIKNFLNSKENKKERFKQHYFKMVQKDIDLINKKLSSGDSEIVVILKTISWGNNFSEINPISYIALKKLENDKSKIISHLGRDSFTNLVVTRKILTFKVGSFPEKDFSKEIEDELSFFEKSTWKTSPMLDNLYILKCVNLVNCKRYSDLYDTSIIVEKMRDAISKNKEDPTHITPISYKIQSLSGLKKYERVIESFQKIPPHLLEVTDRRYLAGISRIYAALSFAYIGTGKTELACAYQELALAKMYLCFLDRNDPAVIEQAILLQNYLEKKGDLIAIRNLENRYNLKPLPRQPGEK